MSKLLLGPKHVIPGEYKDREVFFLAGPIRGGGGWQMEAAELLWEKHPECIVVDPSRWDVAEKVAKTDEERNKIIEHRKNYFGIKDDILYPHQAGWESNHMEMASKKGTLIFWLEKESKTEARPREEGVYAQDTRVEIGMWLEKIKNDPSLNVKISGHWEIDEKGKETENSFGGMNFIAYYLTGEKDRKKIYNGEINNEHLVLAKNVEEFLEKSF
jgi:hypothetical protein